MLFIQSEEGDQDTRLLMYAWFGSFFRAMYTMPLAPDACAVSKPEMYINIYPAGLGPFLKWCCTKRY